MIAFGLRNILKKNLIRKKCFLKNNSSFEIHEKIIFINFTCKVKVKGTDKKKYDEYKIGKQK